MASKKTPNYDDNNIYAASKPVSNISSNYQPSTLNAYQSQ